MKLDDGFTALKTPQLQEIQENNVIDGTFLSQKHLQMSTGDGHVLVTYGRQYETGVFFPSEVQVLTNNASSWYGEYFGEASCGIEYVATKYGGVGWHSLSYLQIQLFLDQSVNWQMKKRIEFAVYNPASVICFTRSVHPVNAQRIDHQEDVSYYKPNNQIN